MRIAAIAILAAILVPAAAAAGKGGSVTASVPAPKVGQYTVQEVDVSATGSATTLQVKVTNRKALQKGFGAIGIVVDPKTAGGETFQVFLVMYMGNFSASPASTVQLQLTPPAGVKLGKPKAVKAPLSAQCKQFKSWDKGFESGSDHFTDSSGHVVTLEDTLPPFPGWDVSPTESFLDGMMALMWSGAKCPGHPEDASKEPGDSPK